MRAAERRGSVTGPDNEEAPPAHQREAGGGHEDAEPACCGQVRGLAPVGGVTPQQRAAAVELGVARVVGRPGAAPQQAQLEGGGRGGGWG